MLDTTVESVNSALKRARASLQQRLPSSGEREPPPAPDSPAEQLLVEKFVRAYASGDIDALIALFTDNIRVSMPPIPNEYHGRDAAARLYTRLIRQGRTYEFVPARANGQPALGTYLRGADGIRHAAGFAVLSLAGDRISAVTRFENSVLPWFDLPPTLDD
jgi:hypothetical protein